MLQRKSVRIFVIATIIGCLAGLGVYYATTAIAQGPYFGQGATVDLCIGTTGSALDHVYAEEGADAGKLGTCGTDYTQLPTVSDPDGYPFPVPGATTATDVVTVNPVSPDPLAESTTATFTYQMVAASSKGYQISTWSISGNPSGVTIGTSDGLITGTDVAPGTYDITVTAVDTNGVAGSVEFELDV